MSPLHYITHHHPQNPTTQTQSFPTFFKTLYTLSSFSSSISLHYITLSAAKTKTKNRIPLFFLKLLALFATLFPLCEFCFNFNQGFCLLLYFPFQFRFKFMESPQSVVSPLKILSETEKKNLDYFARNPSVESKKPEPSIGVLEVCIHQAREIQNICIYHKQDVYAKISLTSNPEKSVQTQTINGGGQNPVFNETLCIDVPTVDSSLKCEIYMMSRVRNYLEDQLLGFALIPLSDVIIKNGERLKEFTLTSNDVFHSPSGFVQLSLSYTGVSPDVIVVSPTLPPAKIAASDQSELDKLEFPDPKIVNENEIMVSEYFGISSESLVSSDTDDQASSENGGPFLLEVNQKPDTPDSPPTSVSTNGSQCANQESDSILKEKPVEGGSDSILKDKPVEGGSDLVLKDKPAEGGSVNQPVVPVNFELDQKVVQQDFVDLYMKSMQQFTESLAKMKLPLEMETEQTSSGNSSSGQNSETPNGTRPRVFYGSRAFF
ncbi:hypothetical protein QVD17_27144 [Tagetes erecta]|uniref:C2 domain-containing protein n=1 Tax=Tagetes erecta TaxID=13708 RepID=A0AAD8NRD6_TARER|nr:hypothetical protein QVD17_27144 [Tagetes erecta]